MAIPSWQTKAIDVIEDDAATLNVRFHNAKKFFAVDASGSTVGGIMRAQEKAVLALYGNADDSVTLWSHKCDNPRLLKGVDSRFFNGYGGTSPVCILKNSLAVDQIKDSDLWVLLTDGEIATRDVSELTQMADILDVLQIPLILIITGARYDTPQTANISVGIPFFANAREALILFNDYTTKQLFVIDAKGAFEPLKSRHPNSLSSWDSLPSYRSVTAFDKQCEELAIEFAPKEARLSTRGVSLGAEWDRATGNALVLVPTLLDQKELRHEDLSHLLREEALTQLALLCKTRGQLGLLRDLILRHKQEEIIVRLEDRHGARQILEQMQTANPDEASQLMEQLRQAHTANRETYQALQNSPSEEGRLAKETNRLINQALAVIAGFEKSSYTADILNRKSNRAMRSEVVSAADAEIHLSALDLSDEVEACRGTCPICCGESQIMSIVLKRLDTVEENTSDFALNFPLAAAQAKQNSNMVSSQCICFQCALLLPRSIFQEDIVATIPSVDYAGPNKKYIIHQLTLAITAGLATGAPGIVQLFTTILDRTLETKTWCSKDNTQDTEVQLRRQVLDWTLMNLLRKCMCRNNFNETGAWVTYPHALKWAMDDFATAGLDSWIIQYPLAGFSQILRWYALLGEVEDHKLVAIQKAKLMHQTIVVMMNALLHQKNDAKSWTLPFMHLIYQGFNAPGVPRDMGTASLVSTDKFWSRLEDALGQWQDVKRFLSYFMGPSHASTRRDMTSRIQLITFWALFTQKGHTTPKTYFANIKSREPLAPAALDPTATIPQEAVKEILMSLFCPLEAPEDIHRSDLVPPFANPFGASVLRCGQPGCGFEFFSKHDIHKGTEFAAQAIRLRRSEHLNKAYGVGGSSTSQTGLPDPTSAPKAPTSYHYTFHISIARTWSALDYAHKQAISNGLPPAVASFARDVRLEICGKSRRGNIYSATIEDEVRTVLPSFLDALRVASQKSALGNETLSYVHDWTKNTIAGKMEYELELES